MVEQRYQAVLAVISDGLSITQVASKVGVSRQTLHAWLARYEAEGLQHRNASRSQSLPAPYRGIPRRDKSTLLGTSLSLAARRPSTWEIPAETLTSARFVQA